MRPCGHPKKIGVKYNEGMDDAKREKVYVRLTGYV